MFSGKKKRPLEVDDDDDSMPISKRINRLQIRPAESAENSDNMGFAPHGNFQSVHLNAATESTCIPGLPCANLLNAQHHPRVQTGPLQGGPHPNHAHPCQMSPIAGPSHIPDVLPQGYVQQIIPRAEDQDSGISSTSDADSYEPELDATGNPYYFHVNQVLHQAHLSRVQRNKSKEYGN